MVSDVPSQIHYQSILWFSALLIIVSLSILVVDNYTSFERHSDEFSSHSNYQYNVMPKFLFSLYDCDVGYANQTDCKNHELAYFEEMVQKENLIDKIFNLSYANNIRESLAHVLMNKSMVENKLINPWTGIYEMVKSHNHTWCSLCRDNWACYGKQYDKSLKQTPPFMGFNLLNVPKNTVIFAEGNSLLAEKLYYLVCETNKVLLNNKHLSSGGLDALIKPGYNDMFLHLSINNLLLVLFDNHYSLDTAHVINILRKIAVQPTIIIIGHTNTGGFTEDSARFHAYHTAFPNVPLINQTFGFSHRSCTAPYCKNDLSHHHQCSPGSSVIADAQDLIEIIMTTVSRP